MPENRLTYRRKLSNVGSWTDFSVQHVAFAFHRLTGWLLLGWVLFHLGIPATTSGASVWNPLTELSGSTAKVFVVGLFTVLVFHVFNGVRLLVAEFLGTGISDSRRAFVLMMGLVILLVVGLGVTV